VIPAYNAEGFLARAIDSCLGQTYRPLEVVVVDDGSTDATPVIARRYPVKVIRHPANLGTAQALNTGFESANGEYVAWLSADDWFMDRRKTQDQTEKMRRGQAAWSYYSWTDDIVGLVGGWWFARNDAFRLLALLLCNPINGSTVMIRRTAFHEVGGFNPGLGRFDQDAELWMRLSALRYPLTTLTGRPVGSGSHSKQSSRDDEYLEACDGVRLAMLEGLEREGRLLRLVAAAKAPLFLMFVAMPFEVKYHRTAERFREYISVHEPELGPLFVRAARLALI